MTNAQVLIIIAAFLLLTVGSFIWFIATWNAEAEDLTTPIRQEAWAGH